MEEEKEVTAPDMTMLKGVMTVIYILVFMTGTPGNLWIIYKLVRARLWNSSAAHLTVSQRSRLYICALACSDLLLLMTLPFTASYNYNGTWKFGEVMCYTILTIEIVTKIFSVVLLTVMSLERYFIVCTRLRNSFQSWMSCVPLAVGTAFCVLVPSAFHFVHIIHHKFDFPGMVSQEEITICIPNMEDSVFDLYAQYTFFAGFVIPFAIMAFCYIMLVRHVKQKFKNRKIGLNAQKLVKEPRYMAEMRKSIWRIAVFHFVCWAPFWAFTIVPHYLQFFFDKEFMDKMPRWYVYCRLFANCLPYINAAGNWVLYAVLNSDVRKHIYHQPRKSNFKFGFQSLSTV